jgi:hypothetical protein
VESILGPRGTAATPGLLYLPRVILRMEKLVEWTVLAGETEILEENLPRHHFVHHKSHLPDLGANPSRRGGKPATNRFSYGAALLSQLTFRPWRWKRYVPSKRRYTRTRLHVVTTQNNTYLKSWECRVSRPINSLLLIVVASKGPIVPAPLMASHQACGEWL